MRRMLLLAAGLLLLGAASVRGDDPAPPHPEPGPVELIEDLRVLSLVNGIHPTRDQLNRLALVAETAREDLARLDARLKARLQKVRPELRDAREKLLRGGSTPANADSQLSAARLAIETTRTAHLETLIQDLTARVQRILTAEQAALIENELAPSFNQPWRQYAQMLGNPRPGSRSAARLPADPGKWLGELRDLRVDSAEGDPSVEIRDFGKKMTRGIPEGSPLYAASVRQAEAFATQVLAMPQNVFQQRERELARLVARQELATRNQQREAEGKPAERFDPYRWFVEEVLLSPRAATDLRDRAVG